MFIYFEREKLSRREGEGERERKRERENLSHTEPEAGLDLTERS